MELGQRIYLLPDRIPASFQGIASNGFVRALVDGNVRLVQRDKVQGAIPGRPPKWSPGSACTVEIYGLNAKPLGAEVVSSKPLKARVTVADPVWFGCVVSASDGKIRRKQ